MTRHERLGRHQVSRQTTRRIVRGYAKSRQAYDRRRRQTKLDSEGRDYAAIVRRDPCSYCGGFCGQMAADHIVGLDDGGQNAWDNLTAAGRPCNAAKREKRLLVFLLSRLSDG